jgi:hypothetical protein
MDRTILRKKEKCARAERNNMSSYLRGNVKPCELQTHTDLFLYFARDAKKNVNLQDPK